MFCKAIILQRRIPAAFLALEPLRSAAYRPRRSDRSLNRTKALRHDARTTLEYIIKHIPEGELPASFVGSPEVRQLMAKSS